MWAFDLTYLFSPHCLVTPQVHSWPCAFYHLARLLMKMGSVSLSSSILWQLGKLVPGILWRPRRTPPLHSWPCVRGRHCWPEGVVAGLMWCVHCKTNCVNEENTLELTNLNSSRAEQSQGARDRHNVAMINLQHRRKKGLSCLKEERCKR